MGKGDHRRPSDVDAETFAENWERIFAKEAKESRDRIRKAIEDVFSEGGIADLEEVPRASGEPGQAEDESVAGQSPHVEGG